MPGIEDAQGRLQEANGHYEECLTHSVAAREKRQGVMEKTSGLLEQLMSMRALMRGIVTSGGEEANLITKATDAADVGYSCMAKAEITEEYPALHGLSIKQDVLGVDLLSSADLDSSLVDMQTYFEKTIESAKKALRMLEQQGGQFDGYVAATTEVIEANTGVIQSL